VLLAVFVLAAPPALSACGSDSPAAPEAAAAPAAGSGDPQAPPPASTADSGEDAANVQATRTAAPPPPEPSLTLETPPGAHAAIWVRAGKRVPMRTEPGGGELVKRIGRRTEFGSASVFGVVERRGRWVGVSTELLANGRLGWIKLDPRRLKEGWTRYSIVVDLSDRSAKLLRGERTKMAFAVTIGAPGSTTPIGRFSVTDTFTDLDSAAYGCCALAVSATQPNLPSGWLGGRRIAIHGTSGPLGTAASHGCVRAADATVAKLIDRVPLGTPVVIRA
jgi:hypothetical protein